MDSTPESLENTKDQFRAKSQITFRDMADLQGVRENRQIFSFLFTYLRYDFVRVFAAEEIIRESNEIFVFANLNLPSLTEGELLDDATLASVEKFGLVMSQVKDRKDNYENNFFIRANTNPNMRVAIEEILVRNNILRVKEFLEVCRGQQTGQLPIQLSQEIVYKSYPSVFMKFFALEDMGEFTEENVLKFSDCPLFSKVKRFKKFDFRVFNFKENEAYKSFVMNAIAEKRGVIYFLHPNGFIPTKSINMGDVDITGIYPEIMSNDPEFIEKVMAILKS